MKADSTGSTTLRIMVNTEEAERKCFSCTCVISELWSELRCAAEKCWQIRLNSACSGSLDIREMLLLKTGHLNASAWRYTVKSVSVHV